MPTISISAFRARPVAGTVQGTPISLRGGRDLLRNDRVEAKKHRVKRIYCHTREDYIARFWSRVVKGAEPDSCWGWAGTLLVKPRRVSAFHPADPYVCPGFWKTSIPAARYSWIVHFGPVPDGLFVCHHCDNPVCTNPSHLFIGTALDNTRDMLEKGRASKRGPRNFRIDAARFLLAQEMRRMHHNGVSIGDMAKQFGMHFSTVYRTVVGERWAGPFVFRDWSGGWDARRFNSHNKRVSQ